MNRLLLTSGGLVLAMAMPTLAQAQSSSISVGVSGGTLGIGPEVGVRLSPTLSVRGSATFLGFSHSVDGDEIEYDGDLKLASVGAALNLHPFENGFRVSAGARYNKNKVKLKATPSSSKSVEIGGATYAGSQIGTLHGAVRVKEFAPTLTLGYGSGLTKGVTFGIDAGVMFEGKPRIRNLRASGPIASDPSFQSALAREEQDIRDDVEKYDIFPIVQLSLGYAF
jgi:hypothetical protein